jgi:hypothetical protein
MQKEDKSYAEVAEETNSIVGLPFAPSAKPLRRLRSVPASESVCDHTPLAARGKGTRSAMQTLNPHTGMLFQGLKNGKR